MRCKHKPYDCWRRWFAWYPVYIRDDLVWFEQIERRIYSRSMWGESKQYRPVTGKSNSTLLTEHYERQAACSIFGGYFDAAEMGPGWSGPDSIWDMEHDLCGAVNNYARQYCLRARRRSGIPLWHKFDYGVAVEDE